MAGKTEIERQGGEVIAPRQQVQSARQPQPEVVAVQRYAFDLLEHLGEVDGRTAYLSGDVGERPASAEIAGEQDLDPINQPLPPVCGSGLVRCAWSEAATHEGQEETLGLERFDRFPL